MLILEKILLVLYIDQKSCKNGQRVEQNDINN